jgi:hypothetical protein
MQRASKRGPRKAFSLVANFSAAGALLQEMN